MKSLISSILALFFVCILLPCFAFGLENCNEGDVQYAVDGDCGTKQRQCCDLGTYNPWNEWVSIWQYLPYGQECPKVCGNIEGCTETGGHINQSTCECLCPENAYYDIGATKSGCMCKYGGDPVKGCNSSVQCSESYTIAAEDYFRTKEHPGVAWTTGRGMTIDQQIAVWSSKYKDTCDGNPVTWFNAGYDNNKCDCDKMKTCTDVVVNSYDMIGNGNADGSDYGPWTYGNASPGHTDTCPTPRYNDNTMSNAFNCSDGHKEYYTCIDVADYLSNWKWRQVVCNDMRAALTVRQVKYCSK